MSERTDLVSALVEAINARDAEGIRRCLDRDVTVRRPLPDIGIASHPADVGTYRGVDEVVRALDALFEATGGIHLEIRELDEIGDVVVAEVLALIGPEEERSAQLVWSVMRFDAGQIVSTETFASRSAAQESITRGE